MNPETNKMQNKLTKIAVMVLATLACYGVQAANKGVAVDIKPIKAVLQSNEDVVVNVTITNTTGKDQLVLKWYTPFNEDVEGLFEVFRDGVKVAYSGAHYKRGAPKAADYLLLKAGKSYQQKVELSAMYDMSVTGNYSIRYNVGSANLFSANVANGLVAAEKGMGELKSGNIELYINGRSSIAASPAPSPAPTLAQTLAGSLSFTNCSATQAADITTAVANAKTYAAGASSYLAAGTAGPRYTTWFGANDAARFSTVKTQFAAIGSAFNNQPVVVDCKCNKTYYAYVFPNQPYKIYVCKAFWTAPPIGTDSKAGTLVHEMSHFSIVAGTDDWAYGQTAAKSLAISDPAKAVNNADSHEYFSENTPALN
jgi:peptidyl-Lys metalloendopeptidase